MPGYCKYTGKCLDIANIHGNAWILQIYREMPGYCKYTGKCLDIANIQGNAWILQTYREMPGYCKYPVTFTAFCILPRKL